MGNQPGREERVYATKEGRYVNRIMKLNPRYFDRFLARQPEIMRRYQLVHDMIRSVLEGPWFNDDFKTYVFAYVETLRSTRTITMQQYESWAGLILATFRDMSIQSRFLCLVNPTDARIQILRSVGAPIDVAELRRYPMESPIPLKLVEEMASLERELGRVAPPRGNRDERRQQRQRPVQLPHVSIFFDRVFQFEQDHPGVQRIVFPNAQKTVDLIDLQRAFLTEDFTTDQQETLLEALDYTDRQLRQQQQAAADEKRAAPAPAAKTRKRRLGRTMGRCNGPTPGAHCKKRYHYIRKPLKKKRGYTYVRVRTQRSKK
jgi:hypothetical protein